MGFALRIAALAATRMPEGTCLAEIEWRYDGYKLSIRVDSFISCSNQFKVEA